MNVSFVIPCFNASKTIRQTVNSVLTQVADNDEIILVNDGSTDATLEIIAGFKDERVVVISQDNHGVSYSRNVGARFAKGDIIVFFDSDDTLSPGIVELVKKAFQRFYNINWCFGYYSIAHQDTSTLVKSQTLEEGIYHSVFELYKSFGDRNSYELLSTCSLYFRRSAFIEIGGFDTNIISGEDTFMWLKFGLENPRIYYLNEQAFIYQRLSIREEWRRHKLRSRKELQRIHKGYKLIFEDYHNSEYRDDAKKIVDTWSYRHMKLSLCLGNIRELMLLVILRFRYSVWK